jgi:simple sugar transport system permease protein
MTDLFASAIRLTVPVAYAAVGETVAERSGLLNVGLEGGLLLGALGGAWAASATGSVLIGFGAAALVGMLVFAAVGLLCTVLRADQIVVGIGLNLIGLGGTAFIAATVPEVGRAPGLDPISIPGLSEIPFFGEVLFEQNAAFFGLILSVVLVTYILRHTAWGLWVRAAGETPSAVDAAGVSVNRVRVQAMALCGALVGLGGAALSIGDLRGFTENLVAGRGFIALAAVIFGRWKPGLVLGACFVFGLTDALRFQFPDWGINLPASVLVMLPYIVTLVALALVRKGDRAPAALTIPFVRVNR